MWSVRGQYPSGDVVQTFATEAAAEAVRQRHLAKGVPVATLGPLDPGMRGMVPARCSFCGKERSRVSGLVAGPSGAGVAICDQCVALCADLLGESAGSGSQA